MPLQTLAPRGGRAEEGDRVRVHGGCRRRRLGGTGGVNHLQLSEPGIVHRVPTVLPCPATRKHQQLRIKRTDRVFMSFQRLTAENTELHQTPLPAAGSATRCLSVCCPVRFRFDNSIDVILPYWHLLLYWVRCVSIMYIQLISW